MFEGIKIGIAAIKARSAKAVSKSMASMHHVEARALRPLLERTETIIEPEELAEMPASRRC